MEEFEADEEEAKKYLNYHKDKITNVEYALLSSPLMNGCLKIKNPRVPISTSAKGLAELKYVEMQVNNLEVVPDFGYENDNFILKREDRTGWEALTSLCGEKHRY